MKQLEKALFADIKKTKAYRTELIKAVKTSNAKDLEGWQLRDLLTPTTKNKDFGTIKALKNYLGIRWNKQIDKLIAEVPFKLSFHPELLEVKEMTITVEWKKNRTWGSNPTAESFVYGLGHISSGSIGGCGYDKQSAAVANILNQVPQFKQLLYIQKNRPKNNGKSNNNIFGYGSGYGVLPYFESGVGVNCYIDIFKAIGYDFKTLSSGKRVDVYQVTK